MKKVLIALGGNALLRANESGTDKEQLKHVKETCLHFLKIIESGYNIAITHGNGPQVGAILLKNELCSEKLPSMPLDICGAESQGLIGYMIQRELYNILERNSKDIKVISILTQVLVDKKDEAFENPTKPIGPFYRETEKNKIEKERGWKMVYQEGKGFRRVVPSPIPLSIIEGDIIKKLFDEEYVVIACGGGGIPVIREDEDTLIGVEAVIDKDRTAAVLAKRIGAETLLILTDVERVALDFGKPSQKNLSKLSEIEAEKYIKEGQFGKGSMEPKIEAAINFLKHGGKKAIITSLEKSKDALDGKTGTVITL
jgi:carbamate kinase